MGVPEFQVRHIIRANKVTALSSNFELYGDLSSRVMSILAETSLDMEIYSIDEAFLDFSNVSNAFEYASELRAKIKQWTGIPTSIGLAPTKTLGKMANMIAKKRTTNGVFEINKDNLSKTLESVSVDEIWGIGAKSANKLKLMGIFTAEQFVITSYSIHYTKLYEKSLLHQRSCCLAPPPHQHRVRSTD